MSTKIEVPETKEALTNSYGLTIGSTNIVRLAGRRPWTCIYHSQPAKTSLVNRRKEVHQPNQ
jgi:hypothetical protein